MKINDSLFYNQSLDTLQEFYKNAIRENLHLYNGSQYLQYGLKVKGSPFFESENFLQGDIYYGGELYKNVKMHYDLENGDVIINNFSEDFPIKLLPEKIKYFTLLGHIFVHFSPGNEDPSIKRLTFFDLIYNGKIADIFVKREKKLEISLNTEDNIPAYKQYDHYYLKINGHSYEMTNIKSLPEILRDRRNQVKKFIRNNHISRKKMSDDSIRTIIEYYTQLKN